MHHPDLSQSEINSLLAYLDYFNNDSTFTFHKNGYEFENEIVMEFRKTLTDSRFLIVFDWIDWLNSHEQYKDVNRDIAVHIRNADMETLRKLMTSYIRGDRFNEGLFISVIKNGTVVAILKRVKELQG